MHFSLSWLQDQWVCGLDVVVDDVVREDTTLALRQEEEWELFIKLALTWGRLMWIMNVEDATGKA